MKYAQLIINEEINLKKLGRVQAGLKPDGDEWVEVKQMWSIPTDYPSSFYSPTSNKPRIAIVEGVPYEDELGELITPNEVHETWGFTLKGVDSIKTEVYQAQKEERQQKQLGSFMAGELPVTLKDREDSLIISSLPESDTRYKLGQGNWITLSAAEVIALKEAHRLHVQAAYDWEMGANAEVDALVTIDELAAYLFPPEA